MPIDIRPTIEITFMPSINNSSKIMQAGFMAGAPYNPFKKYNKKYKFLISK